jgi:hypothetical protein
LTVTRKSPRDTTAISAGKGFGNNPNTMSANNPLPTIHGNQRDQRRASELFLFLTPGSTREDKDVFMINI